jgi:hypothetical protein
VIRQHVITLPFFLLFNLSCSLISAKSSCGSSPLLEQHEKIEEKKNTETKVVKSRILKHMPIK